MQIFTKHFPQIVGDVSASAVPAQPEALQAEEARPQGKLYKLKKHDLKVNNQVFNYLIGPS